MIPWTQSADEVLAKLSTDGTNGLSSEEAKKRLATYGSNSLPEAAPHSVWSIFFSQFASILVWVLIGATAIAAFLGEWIDAIAIFVITLLNAALGFVQEWRSTRAMEALSRMVRPTCKVVRDGHMQTIRSTQLVPGDLLLLEAGDEVAADARILHCYELQVQEAALTGESLSVDKSEKRLTEEKLPPGDRVNMVFKGTTVTYGKAYAVVTATGLETELGHIAQLLSSVEERQTPLQISLERLGKRIVYLCLVIVAGLFGAGVLQGIPLYKMLMTSLSLAVAAIPEALPAVVTISLAAGMRRMAKRNALIRRLSAVETLGCTTVICTDKTGTLTENSMRVHVIQAGARSLHMTGAGYVPEGEFLDGEQSVDPKELPELMQLLRIAARCNSSSLEKKSGAWTVNGDPTEGALLVSAVQAGISLEALQKETPLLAELPFDSERKMMSLVVRDGDRTTLFLKGAPDVVIARSTLGETERREVEAKLEELAAKGLRLIGIATRDLPEQSHYDHSVEQDLHFLGFLALYDPPRQEAKLAIQQCQQAGIRPIMITGDHKATAMAIAEELGLDHNGKAMDGRELESLSEAELPEAVEETSVFARVSAEHKMRIVKALQGHDQVVAMTGDGVNDAPAIDQADIGVGMGITGTDVTKSVSDMVVLDDNFASIVHAVEEGRGIYDNIVKYTSYLLSCNLAEILVIFFSLFLLGFAHGEAIVILAPIHLLWINVITDGLPAVALAVDPMPPDAMLKPPRARNAPLLSTQWIVRLLGVSATICFLTVAVFELVEPSQAHTAAFTTLVCLELIKLYAMRAAFHTKMWANGYLSLAVLSSISLQLMAVYVPVLQPAMKTVALDSHSWGYIASAVLCFAVIARWVLRREKG